MARMNRTRVHSTGGFWLLMGALLLAASLRLAVWFVVACLIHELGHVAVIRLLGGRVGALHFTGFGLVIQPERNRMVSYREECLIALGGPAASLLLALLAGAVGRWTGWENAYLLTGLSLVLGVFNLLPAVPLDGGRVFRALSARLAGPDTGDRLTGILTRVFGGLLAGTGAWAAGRCGNFTLLLCGFWLLWQSVKTG